MYILMSEFPKYKWITEDTIIGKAMSRVLTGEFDLMYGIVVKDTLSWSRNAEQATIFKDDIKAKKYLSLSYIPQLEQEGWVFKVIRAPNNQLNTMRGF